MNEVLVRTYLFVPGSSESLMGKAAATGADAVILDLEDGVAVPDKARARESVCRWLSTASDVPVWVRINSGPEGAADLQALAPKAAALAGLILAKADVSAVREAATLGVALVPMIETAETLEAAVEIARLPHVATLALGEVDLAADLGITVGGDEVELLSSRSRVVSACRVAGIAAPPAPVSTEITDTDAFRATTERLQRLGFVGRMCIHPVQVEIVNDVVSPRADDVAIAEHLLVAYERSLADGAAVFVDAGGRMVDEAVVRAARRTLALSAGHGIRSGKVSA